MVVDTSAIMAIFKQEPGHEALARAIYFSDETCYMSAANLLETYMIAIGAENDKAAWDDVQEFIAIMGIEPEACLYCLSAMISLILIWRL